MPVAEGTTGAIHLAPVLQGVMEYGGNRRAMLAVNGESVTVRKGDRVGIWSVVSIGEKTVQLSSAAENLFWNCLETYRLFIRRHSVLLFPFFC